MQQTDAKDQRYTKQLLRQNKTITKTKMARKRCKKAATDRHKKEIQNC